MSVVRIIKGDKGGVAVEFAILLPIWLFIFFGLLDYSWYLTNLMIMENAVSAGARAGVKVKYWSDEEEENPVQIAINAVKDSFWLSNSLTDEMIEVTIKDNNTEGEGKYAHYKFLEVRVVNYAYPLLAGFLNPDTLPRGISAISVMAFP